MELKGKEIIGEMVFFHFFFLKVGSLNTGSLIKAVVGNNMLVLLGKNSILTF